MTDGEHLWDKHLQIKTSGRDDTAADQYRFPYEPTPYSVLERLANSGLLRKGDTLLDYGCGKGRVGFFLSYQTKVRSIGIEYDPRIFARAEENRKTALSRARTECVLTRAEDYAVPAAVNRFYFFNPFSVELLRAVMARITASYYAAPREALLFFYFPSDDYVAFLRTVDELSFYDEIDCSDLFQGNAERERILIFKLG